MHKKPDSEPIVWRPGAYGVLENDKGEWLMVEPTWSTRLDFPGGGVEKDESIHEGVTREFYEETGYRVDVDDQPLFVDESYFYHEQLGYCHCVIMIYRATLKDDKRDAHVVNTFEDGYEIRDMRWVSPESLKEEDVSPIFWKFIQSQR